MNTEQAHSDLMDEECLVDLVTRCQDGDREAMEIIYKGYKSSLFNLAYRFSRNYSSAEDLLQEIFIKAFSKISNLRSPEKLKCWMYRIAVNTCINFSRKKGARNEIPFDHMEDVCGHEEDNPHVRNDLERAVCLLPPKQKSIFLLHDVQGFTHSEIAGIMKVRQGTIKSQLFKARMKLRQYLGEQTQ